MNPSKPRILHIVKWYPHDADLQNGVFIRHQIEACADTADQVVLYWGTSDDAFHVSESTENGIPVIRCFFPAKSRLRNLRRKRKSIPRAVKKWGKRPDIIHMHIANADQWIPLSWARKRNIPTVLSEHWSGYMDGRFEGFSPFQKKIRRRIARNADRFVVVSSTLADAMPSTLNPRSIEIIPNIVRVQTAQQPRSGDRNRFVVLADLVDRTKNISGILNVFAKYAAENKAAHLLIIGDGTDKEALQNQAKDLFGDSDRVRFTGLLEHPEAIRELAGGDTLIVNSRQETFSIVLLEALALGLKLICTRCGGPETFLPDELVEWVEVDSDEGLYRAIKNNPNRSFPPAEDVKNLLGQFSPEVVAGRWKALYGELLR